MTPDRPKPEEVLAQKREYLVGGRGIALEDAEELCDALAAALREKEQLERLVIAAGAILGHGTPGSAWMDWIMRVQGVLGAAFIRGRWKDGNAMPFNEIASLISNMPRVSLRELAHSPEEAANDC